METLAGITTFVLHRVGVASRRAIADRLAERPGLTLWQYAALAELTDVGPSAQHALAAGLGIDASDMVRLMDELIAKRLVTRERDPADRRRYRISLTMKGRNAMTTAQKVVREVERTTLQPLTAAERATLHALVTKIHARSVNS
ncbi:DNA-binding MarR family transcriptional regulator [Kribbella antiqua]|uniref:DNA-binding MarR family transcriptional regulator n=1 Tax=Kribbella antiqua TaxID=2512217 RepID=A0A4V2S3C3_9ACTN|nr:MarR family winged helix-turn-helix transcriptional regulator [Kribbella antiqua]TCO43690.1 DNA-binding MarR family transcriptional regulator [Kribbella antiqua]